MVLVDVVIKNYLEKNLFPKVCFSALSVLEKEDTGKIKIEKLAK